MSSSNAQNQNRNRTNWCIPDCCVLYIHYASAELPNEFVFQEVAKSIKSAESLKTKLSPTRAITDCKFGVTDENEYQKVLNIDRIGIGYVVPPVTVYMAGLKMNFYTNYLTLGHARSPFKASARFRKYLDIWDLNHQCNKPVLCVQHKVSHTFRIMECPIVKTYHRTLKMK